MALADTPAPEGIVGPLGEHGLAQQAGQREEAGVPAHRNHRHLAPGLGGALHRGKVLGDAGVGVKAIYHVVEGGQFGGLLRQVGGAAAAENHHVNFFPPGIPLRLACPAHRDARCERREGGRVPPGEDGGQGGVGVLPDGVLHAPAQVAVAHDTNTDCHFISPLFVFFDYSTIFERGKDFFYRGGEQGQCLAEWKKL